MGLSINQVAPDFEAETTQGKIKLHDWVGDGWAVPAADIAAADAWARESWGRSYGWDTVASSPATKNVQ